MTRPIVSVAMSVYNAEPYLAAAIESILNQTFKDFEFIIIDDGSTDHSLKTLQKYAIQDQRIRLTSRENRGIPQTRNEILAQSQGEFIAVMDADDIALPDRLARQVDFLQKHPEVVWVGGAFEVIDEKSRFLTTFYMAEDNDTIQHLLTEGHTSFLHSTAMIRRSSLLQINGYNEAFATGSDLDLWLRLTEIGAVANLALPVVKYRLHTRSITSRSRQHHQQSNTRTILEKAWQRRGWPKRDFETTGSRLHPQANHESQFEYMLQYGWWAFNSRQRSTAFIYGIRAIKINPFSQLGWKLLACSIIKPLSKG